MESHAANRAPRPADLPEILGGRYRVLNEIGRGGMGRVLRVEHLHTGEILAMKLLLGSPSDGARLERFRREARSLAQVRGQHVVRVIDADVATELNNVPYLVMELLEGEDLNSYLKRRSKLDAAEVSSLLYQMALGLARVHRAGLIHRDLKPGNIFLCREENGVSVKLLDFGLVKQALGEDSGITLSLEGQIIGTPVFMSPEQLRGSADEITPATDVWAVGMLAFYLLTGRHYWEPLRMPRGILDIESAPLVPPSKRDLAFTASFDAWFLRSCAINPAARWPDALTQASQLSLALGCPVPEMAALTLKEAEHAPETVTLARAGETSTGSAIARQRRQVTVLFYRLEHAARAAEMDPEDFEALEARLHSALDEAFGDLARSSTDFAQGGRFVFFGYPLAYGHDARRAVEAGLRLLTLVRSLNEQLTREGAGGVDIRVGIHTGVVLAGRATGGAPEVSGAALGVATDLEHRAGLGRVLVSPATWQMLEGRFRGEPAGGGNYVIEDAAEDSQISVAAGAMVGRDLELGMLLSCLEEARGGETQILLIGGEAGIGKSRLIQALRDSPEAAGAEWLECGCSPYFQATPFHALIDLAGTLASSAHEEARNLQYLLGAGDVTEAQKLSPSLRRERAILALISLLHQRAERRPVILVVEDLHWADPSTLEFLDRFSLFRNASVLVLMTARLEFAPYWTSPGGIVPLQLRPLSRAQSTQLIAQTAKSALPAEISEMLSRTAQGIPLFIEELTRLAAHGAPSGGGVARVPATLREALIARLDRLGPARLLAAQAAVIGSVFTLEDLRLLGDDEASLESGVRELIGAKVFQPRGLPPHESYAFQHALLRDVAYDLSPREARRALHARLARAMAARPAAEPEVLAHHFAEGGMPMEAAGAFLRAGQTALERSANAEARDYFQRGIDVLRQAKPASPEQSAAGASLEITLCTMKGMAWVVSRGYAVPEAESSFAAAMERVRALHREETPDLAPALWAQWIFTLVRGRFSEAERQGRGLLALAQRSGDSGIAMLANLAIGCSFIGAGRFEAAVRHLCEGLALYDPAAHAYYRYMFGQDPWMFGSVFKAWALWCLGFPAESRKVVNEALAHAQRLHHPNSLGFALALSALVHHYCGDAEAVERASEALMELSIEQGWIHWLAHARLWGGAAQVMRGNLEAGIEEIRAARQLSGQAGERSGATHYDTVLIETLLLAGRVDEAAQLTAVSKRNLHESGEFGFQAGLLCAEAEIAWAQGDFHGARALFAEALQSAASRRALSYRLRIALRAARLESGVERQESLARLREIFAEFTEGFDTADLRAARALLDDASPLARPQSSGGKR